MLADEDCHVSVCPMLAASEPDILQDWGFFSYELLLLSLGAGFLLNAGSFQHACCRGRHFLREGSPALDQVSALIPICRVRRSPGTSSVKALSCSCLSQRWT